MALRSIRALDFMRLLPRPYCKILLADFTAEVTKVEDPKMGDYKRIQLQQCQVYIQF